MLYCFWDMARDRCNFYFSFLSIFCPFTPLQPKNWKFQKNENTPGDNIVLHKCTKNHDQMLYCSWDMVHDWYNCYFSFRVIPPLTHTHTHTHTHNFKKMKTKTSGRCYTVPEIWCMTDVIAIFHFGLFFALLPP